MEANFFHHRHFSASRHACRSNARLLQGCAASRSGYPEVRLVSQRRTHILGISAFYHDSAACLLRDGEIIAAGQEERFTRKKGDADFPINAVRYCLSAAGISVKDLSCVG